MVWVLSWFFCVLPLRFALAIGKMIGFFWFYVLRIRRKVVFDNIEQAFQDTKTKQEKYDIARGCFINMGMYLVEDLRLPLLNAESVKKLVFRDESFANYGKAAALNKGVIVLCAHIDSWDLMALSQSLMGIPLHVPVRLVHNKSIQAFIEHVRSNAGMQFTAPRGSFNQLVAALHKKEVVAMIMDQHMPPGRGVLVDFFNRVASTTAGAARLAHRTGAPFLPAVLQRRPDGTHLITIEPMFEFESIFENSEDDIRYNTQKITNVVERWVRTYPHSWLWLHRRWKAEYHPKFEKERQEFLDYKKRFQQLL